MCESQVGEVKREEGRNVSGRDGEDGSAAYFAVRGRNLGEDGEERSDEIQKPDCDGLGSVRAAGKNSGETYIRSWWRKVNQGAAGGQRTEVEEEQTRRAYSSEVAHPNNTKHRAFPEWKLDVVPRQRDSA